MKLIRRALARIAALFQGHGSADAELRAEMQAHLDMEIEENIRRGMRPDEARRRALIASGGIAQAADSVRDERGLPWLESITADLRFAVRHFRRTPLSTVTMVVVLSLGIGTNVVLFTVLNSITTMPAPGIARDESVVRIRGTGRVSQSSDVETRLMSWPEVQEYARSTDVFSSVAAYADETAVVEMGDNTATPVTVSLIYATSNYFNVLNIHPVLGSVPAAEANSVRMTSSPTAVISNAMWQQRFGGARDVIGRTIRVNDVPVQIVGVAPPRFLGTDGGNRMTMWAPLAAYPLLQKRSPALFTSYDSTFLSAAAQLRPGITPKTATPLVADVAQRAFHNARVVTAAQSSQSAQGQSESADVVPMLASNSHIGDRMDMLVSGAASGGFALLILLITCTNVSALMVGLAVARRKEIGVRLSLGAPRKRLIRQLLTESILLSLVAAAIGLTVTAIGIRIVGARLEDVQLIVDWRVTIATCAVAIVTGVLFGLSPALHATRVSLGEVLKSSSTSMGGSRSLLQKGLVVAQIALTQPMLVGIGVVALTMVSDMNGRVTSAVPDQIAEVELDTWSGRVSNAERSSRIDAIVARVAALPGVVNAIPMQLGTTSAPLTVHPSDRVPGITYEPAMITQLAAAPKGFFSAYNIPVIRGRDFDGSEYGHAGVDPGVLPSFNRVIVGSDLARKLWGKANPIGRRLALAGQDSAALTMVVVGVVDAAAAGPSVVNNQYHVYVPYSAIYTGVIARTAGPALPFLNTMRKVVTTEAPQMPVKRVETMQQREAASRRLVLRASEGVAGAGLLALLLSAIGLYAVMSFAIAQRTREIGIRTTLGAQSSQVLKMFFGQGLTLSAFGLALGLPLSMLAIRMLTQRSHLFGQNLNLALSSSPLLGVGIAVVVLLVAAIAVFIPARRASTIDPNLALRMD